MFIIENGYQYIGFLLLVILSGFAFTFGYFKIFGKRRKKKKGS